MSYLTIEQKKQLKAIRKALDGFVIKIVESPSEINENLPILRKWQPGSFNIGDVRLYIDTPYKCVQAHDSTANETWTPDATPSLWMQYHGTSKDSARPWIQPLGSHDMYKVNEYMIWTDGDIYKCIIDTTYSPSDYPAAWNNVSKNSWTSGSVYHSGEYALYNGSLYRSLIDNNYWSPDEYPTGWELIKE